MQISKSKVILECGTCGHMKDTDRCYVCLERTPTIEYVSNPDKNFIGSLIDNEDPRLNPFDIKIIVDGIAYNIESYGEDSNGVFLQLYKKTKKEHRILKIYPKE